MTGEEGGSFYSISPNISVGKEIGKIFTQLQTLKAEGGGSHTLCRGNGLKGHGLLRVLSCGCQNLEVRSAQHGLVNRGRSETSTQSCPQPLVLSWGKALGLCRARGGPFESQHLGAEGEGNEEGHNPL